MENSPGLSPIGSPGLRGASGSRKAVSVFLTSSSISTSFTASSASSIHPPAASHRSSPPFHPTPPSSRATTARQRGSRRGVEEEHVYENPLELVAVVAAGMTSTLSSLEGGKETLSSVEGSLSPASRLRLAADLSRRHSGGSDDDSGCALEEFSWVPSGLRADLVHHYFSLLPEDKVPYQGSAGEKWRVRQLLLQLPPQDSEARYCRTLSPSEARELRQFAAQRKREALGRGTPRPLPFALNGKPCQQCGEAMRTGELGVFCGRIKGAVWHPACFVCGRCEELLVDLIYFATPAGGVLCGRHHAETHKPRCMACDEIIFSEECTEAEGGSWHLEHFACIECDLELGGQRYVIREDRPYCLPCFQRVFPDLCAACRRPIGTGQPRVALDSAQWHADDACYACTACHRSLLGKPALPRRGALFCSVDCTAAAAPAPASSSTRRTSPPKRPPRLNIPQTTASSDEENDYETVPSFRASPPHSPPDLAHLRQQLDRMTMSVHQEREPEQAVSRRKHWSASRRQRRHRSLTDLRGSEDEAAVACAGSHVARSSGSSKGSSSSSSSRPSRPSVTFCASAREPRAWRKPKSRGHRRCRRGSSETTAETESGRSYAKAIGYHGGRLEARFRDDAHLVEEEPIYADVSGLGASGSGGARRRDSLGGCSTCSSSSSEDEAGGADYLTADFLLSQLRSRSAHNSLRRPRAPAPPPPATPSRRRPKGPANIRGSKLAASQRQPNSNCIVS